MNSFRAVLIYMGDYSGMVLRLHFGSHYWGSYYLPAAALGHKPIAHFQVDDGAYQRTVIIFETGDNWYTQGNSGPAYGYTSWAVLPGTYDSENRIKWMWYNEQDGNLVGVSHKGNCYRIYDLFHGDMTFTGASPAYGATEYKVDYWMAPSGRLHLAYRRPDKTLAHSYSDDGGENWTPLVQLAAGADNVGQNDIGRPSINGWGSTVHILTTDGDYEQLMEYLSETEIRITETFSWAFQHFYSLDDGASWDMQQIEDGGGGIISTYREIGGIWTLISRNRWGNSLHLTLPTARVAVPLTDTTLYAALAICALSDGAMLDTVYVYAWPNPADPTTYSLVGDESYGGGLGWMRDYMHRWIGGEHGDIAYGAIDTPAVIYDVPADVCYEPYFYGGYGQLLPETVNMLGGGGYSFWW